MIDAHGVEEARGAGNPPAQPVEVGCRHGIPAVHGQAPVLTALVERVRRCADVAAEIEFVRPRPHVRAVPRDHEGEISLQANTHLGGCPSCRVPLLGREPLHVFVEQAVPLELMRGRRHGRRLAVAERPLP